MSLPRRIQRKRRRGWRMPEGAIYVGRPTVWGNPFRVTRSSDYHGLPGSWFLLDDDGNSYHPEHDTQSSARGLAVELYAARLAELSASDAPGTEADAISVERARAELAGHDLVCWCPADEPCHVDVLLEVANERSTPVSRRRRAAGTPGSSRPER